MNTHSAYRRVALRNGVPFRPLQQAQAQASDWALGAAKSMSRKYGDFDALTARHVALTAPPVAPAPVAPAPVAPAPVPSLPARDDLALGNVVASNNVTSGARAVCRVSGREPNDLAPVDALALARFALVAKWQRPTLQRAPRALRSL